MITLNGTSVRRGASMGTGVRFGNQGLSPLPARLIDEALQAMKRQLPEDELPQVVLLCDDLSTAAFVRWPGLKIVGMAARQAASQTLPPIDVPVVADIGSQLDIVSEGNIVIIDGTRGLVFVEPDAQTVQRYESMLSGKRENKRFFLGSGHVPAQTMDGRIVSVAVIVKDNTEAANAIAEGADELIFIQKEEIDLPEALSICGGKPITMAIDDPSTNLLHTALWHTGSKQVRLGLSADNFADLRIRLEMILKEMLSNRPEDSLEASEIVMGIFSRSPVTLLEGAEFLLLWPESPNPAEWNTGSNAENVVLIVGTDLDSAREPIINGLGTVAVAPGLVEEAKNLIRSLPPDYVVGE